MLTRNYALAVIRAEYATHGHETRESMRVYIENRISIIQALCKSCNSGKRAKLDFQFIQTWNHNMGMKG